MSKRNNKIKYFKLNSGFIDEEEVEWLVKAGEICVCDNPTEYDNLPNGTYIIRGNQKDTSREFYKFGNAWYVYCHWNGKEKVLDKDELRDKLGIYPHLTDKEWDVLLTPLVYTKLNDKWKGYCNTYRSNNYFGRLNTTKGIDRSKYYCWIDAIKEYDIKFNGKTFLTESRIVEVPKVENLSFVERLKEYFDKTPRSKIEEDWNHSIDCDNIGCTVDSFLEFHNLQIQNKNGSENQT